MWEDWGIQANVHTCLVQYRRFTSLAQRTVRCWRTTLWSLQHLAATAGLGSLLVGCSLNVIVNFVFADVRAWLVVADGLYTQLHWWETLILSADGAVNWHSKAISSSRWLECNPLTPKIDKFGWGACRLDRCESILINLLADTISLPWVALKRFLSKLWWEGWSLIVHRQVCHQHTHYGCWYYFIKIDSYESALICIKAMRLYGHWGIPLFANG